MSTTKRIVAGALGLATALSLVATAAVLTASAQSANYNFTQNLTVGSSGSDVTSLQQLLASKGFFTVAPTGYFGPITKAAVAAWQASAGLPSTGYFGPLSRAAVNSMAMTGGSSTTGSFNCPTGWVCTAPVQTTPTCPAGYTCTSASGTVAPVTCPAGFTCTANSTTPAGNQEGVLTLTLAGSPSNQTNIQQYLNVPVWGVQLQGQIADVNVQRLDLDVRDMNGSSIENPGQFVNTISLFDSSACSNTQCSGAPFYSIPVGLTTFVQGTTSSDYYARLSGFNYDIPANTTKTLVVAFNTNPGIDNTRTLTIRGYPGSLSNLQVQSNGIIDYYDVSGSTGTSFTRSQQFTKPGNSTLTVGIDATNPLSTSFYNDTNAGSTNIPVFVFNVQSTNGNAQITGLTITPTYTTSGDAQAPSTITILAGNTVIASQSTGGSGSAVNFNNIQNYTIPTGTTQPITVEVNVPAFAQTSKSVGTTTVSVSLNGLTYQTSNGNTNSANGLPIAGNNQYFFAATPQLAFLTGSTQPPTVNNNGQTVATGGQLTFTFTPKGGQMVQPVAGDFVIGVGSSLSAARTNIVPVASTSLASITPQPSGSNPLSQGQAYTINLTATANAHAANALITGSGQYQFYLLSASTTVTNPLGGLDSVVQTWGLDNFKSGTVQVIY